MDVTFPDLPGVSGMFLLGHRRRPGSGVSGSNIEQVISIIVKRAYTITASDSDPADGLLEPRENGPEIFEGDQPGAFLSNADFSEGLTGWSETGGAQATVTDGVARVLRDGSNGDIRNSESFGRQVRDRGFGFSVEASGDATEPLPEVRLATSTQSILAGDPDGTFPDSGDQPVAISGYAAFSGSTAATSLSLRLGTMGTDGLSVDYTNASLSAVEYESDVVPFKPEADLIVILDAPPNPISIAVNGTIRLSQEALPQELTGLGWEDRFGTPREAEGGVYVPPPSQQLPNTFNNRYFNGYRRDRRQGSAIPYPPAGAEIEILDANDDLYAFTLTTGAPVATHAWFKGSGDDDPCLWRRRSLDFNLDTLVIEPDRNHAYAVWRAVWPVGEDHDGTGPVPLNNNRDVTVTWEGG